MVRPTNTVMHTRRGELLARIRGCTHSDAGTRVKMDGRVFFVRVSKRTGHVRVIERYLTNARDGSELWQEKQVWCDSARMGVFIERVLIEVDKQKRSKP